MGLRAGELNRVVTLQRPRVGSDSEGSPRTLWENLVTVKAKVETFSSQERITAAQAQLDVSDRVTIRYRSDVDHNWRLLYAGRVLEIVDVVRDERRRFWIELVCQELVV